MKYVVLLRGINVGGNNKLPMAELRELLTVGGFEEVKTYIQSGNIVLVSKAKDTAKVAQKVKYLIQEKFGYDLSVMAISGKEFKSIYQGNSFPSDETINPKNLHVTLFGAKPAKELLKMFFEQSYDGEEYQFKDKHVYLHFLNGYGRAKLTNNFLEKKLKVAATTRNWRTMGKIMELLDD